MLSWEAISAGKSKSRTIWRVRFCTGCVRVPRSMFSKGGTGLYGFCTVFVRVGLFQEKTDISFLFNATQDPNPIQGFAHQNISVRCTSREKDVQTRTETVQKPYKTVQNRTKPIWSHYLALVLVDVLYRAWPVQNPYKTRTKPYKTVQIHTRKPSAHVAYVCRCTQ